jgi:hypothetical protein
MIKSIIKIIFPVLIVIVVSLCEKDRDQTMQIDGYIIGFNPCTINHQYRIGYAIISGDLKDTIVTYNLSDIDFKMPASVLLKPSDTLYVIPELCFANFRNSAYFPVEYQNKFKIKAEYRFAHEEEKVVHLCTADINQADFFEQILNNQVIIISASK